MRQKTQHHHNIPGNHGAEMICSMHCRVMSRDVVCSSSGSRSKGHLINQTGQGGYEGGNVQKDTRLKGLIANGFSSSSFSAVF